MTAVKEWAAARMGRIVTIGPDETVARAAQLMRDNRVGSIVVVDAAGGIVGIITERDIISRSTAASANPQQTRVATVMTPSPLSVTTATPASEANQTMVGRGIRHLPIVEGEKPVGMISSRDILAHQLEVHKAMQAVAERVALMGKSFKSLDLDEVLGVLLSDVPEIFQAERCALHFVDEHAAKGGQPLVQGVNCPSCEKRLVGGEVCPQHCDEARVLNGDVPQVCRELGARDLKLMILLSGSRSAKDAADSEAPRQSFLCMCGLPPGTTVSEELLRYKAELIRNILNVYLINARLYRDVRRSTLVDALTGLASRKGLAERLAVEHQRAVRYGRPLCLAMVDLDHFKGVNDRCGHAAGDELLRELADILRSGTRPTDVPTRYGGDEFVLLMPETKLDQASGAVERIRRHVHEQLPVPEGLSVTISCGVAEWSDTDATVDDLFRRADAALYEAKEAGRDRVVVAGSPVPAASAAPAE